MEHQKDKQSEPIIHNGQTPIRQEKTSQQQGSFYVLRKAEKLTTALYLVTDILSDKEPLKWKTRESGVEVLEDVSSAMSAPFGVKAKMLGATMQKIDHVVSFLDIASSSRMITEMNAGVLKREYLTFKDGVEAEWTRAEESGRALIGSDFFNDDHEVKKEVPPALFFRPLPVMPKRDAQQNAVRESAEKPIARDDILKGDQEIAAVKSVASEPPRKLFIPTPRSLPREEVKEAAPQVKSDEKVIAEVSEVRALPERAGREPRPIMVGKELLFRPLTDVARDDRRKIILALLKQKPAVTVGDISKSITGVSEKTIQRELLAMVAENILLKRGERRWSTYSLRENS